MGYLMGIAKKDTMNRFGFTLIEIITVSFIVGILGLMAIPSLTGMVNRSYAQDAMHNLMAIYSAQKAWYNENLSYTSTLGNLNLNLMSVGGLTYSCTGTVCTAQAGAVAGSFAMKISLAHPVNEPTTPVYCNDLSTPNYNTHNPCCTAGGGAVNTRCP
jgi:prepilin-type N-terminal cleavage/methylation domain-containing protein